MINVKLGPRAKLPVKGSDGAAGFDIHAIESGVIPGGKRALIKTGVTLAHCPLGVYLRVAPRSKLAYRHGLDVLAGVVDGDYRGEIGVIIKNTDTVDYAVQEGDAIAQLIPELYADLATIEEVSNVTPTDRGSSGIHSMEERR